MNKERLLKLAEHLESGKLGHEVFDFNTWNANGPHELAKGGCGTCGCAIGECPIIWPDDWTFDGTYGDPVLAHGAVHDRARISPLRASADWFGIDYGHAYRLFQPFDDSLDQVDDWQALHITPLTENATAADVAANIRRYVAHREQLASV